MNIVDVCIEVTEICWKNGIEVKVGEEKIMNVKMFLKVKSCRFKQFKGENIKIQMWWACGTAVQLL